MAWNLYIYHDYYSFCTYLQHITLGFLEYLMISNPVTLYIYIHFYNKLTLPEGHPVVDFCTY